MLTVEQFELLLDAAILKHLNVLKEITVSALDDLTTAVARVTDSVNALVARVSALEGQVASGVDPAAVETNVVALNTLADSAAAAAQPPAVPAV